MRNKMFTFMVDEDDRRDLEELAELLGMTKAAATRYAVKRLLRAQKVERLEIEKLRETIRNG
jgi:hypothetical protein